MRQRITAMSEHKCPVCKKIFVAYPEWAYKTTERVYCSWHCLREHERRRGPMKYGKSASLSLRQKKEIIARLQTGMGIDQVADELCVTISAVRSILKNMKEEQK